MRNPPVQMRLFFKVNVIPDIFYVIAQISTETKNNFDVTTQISSLTITGKCLTCSRSLGIRGRLASRSNQLGDPSSVILLQSPEAIPDTQLYISIPVSPGKLPFVF